MTRPTVLSFAATLLAACGSSHGTSEPMDTADGGTSMREEASCAEAWADPLVEVEATSRPSSPSMDLRFSYEIVDGRGVITLDEVRAVEVGTPGSDGPFDPSTTAGVWVELQDGGGDALYTKTTWQLVPTMQEAFGPGGPSTSSFCPEDPGFFRSPALPNDASGSEVVLFQPVPGADDGVTVEFARVPLP